MLNWADLLWGLFRSSRRPRQIDHRKAYRAIQLSVTFAHEWTDGHPYDQVCLLKFLIENVKPLGGDPWPVIEAITAELEEYL